MIEGPDSEAAVETILQCVSRCEVGCGVGMACPVEEPRGHAVVLGERQHRQKVVRWPRLFARANFLQEVRFAAATECVTETLRILGKPQASRVSQAKKLPEMFDLRFQLHFVRAPRA